MIQNACHVDSTCLPLRDGLLLYHPEKAIESSLRKHKVLEDRDLRPFPCTPGGYAELPSYMASPWLAMNVLVLNGRRVVIEEQDVELAKWLTEAGMIPIPCPFRHVNSI